MTSTQKPPRLDVLEVQDLRVVDRDGSTLARLARNEFGAFGLAIGESANGCPMIALKVTATGQPCVEIRDRNGSCRALLEVNHANGTVLMGLLDANQQSRACVAVSADGHSTLGLYDPAKTRIVDLKNNAPLNMVFDKDAAAQTKDRIDKCAPKSSPSQVNLSWGRSLNKS